VRILIVRLSSMGDMVHSLPAITDAARALRGVEIDWVVDRAFSEIPAWHFAVRDVIASPPRRVLNLYSQEFKEFVKILQSKTYDLIIDLQGHWKSAFAARLAHGISAGYDKQSVNEWGAQFFYKNQYFVSRNQHSIKRMKELLAHALNYSFDANLIDYGINKNRLPPNSLEWKEPYLVFIHSTSWDSKCWPETYWQELVARSVDAGFSVALPWGTEAERERAERIASNQLKAIVLPKLSISQKASVIAGSSGTVGLDTGLSHIAAALDIPSVTLYGATDPFFIGATGKNQFHLASDFECVKCHRSTCNYPKMQKPACFQKMTPHIVWGSLQRILKRSGKAPAVH
jgi:heptosyltransferase I